MIRNILALLCLLALIYLSFTTESATQVNRTNKDQFSAVSASKYLDNIATAPHPIGSLENQKVRDYIANTLRDEGLDVRIEKGYVNYSRKPTYMRMAYVENIIATLKGSDANAKKVVIAGHYDSVFEGPGAADDGYAIASMIETVKLLKNHPRKSDIELVITDGEEMGLFGAQHYADNNDLSNIGILLNFEARGNAGPGLAFEFSDNNAWLVEEMAKASNRPIANSLSYETYKRMPNGTDFMVFSDVGVQGINYAFIDGFSYYHNPVDNIENLSLESVQHTGENMYRMAKHFANFDFGTPPEGNASFFNFYGNLIHYPTTRDIYILIFGLCLLIFTVYKSSRNKDVNLKGIGVSFIALLGIIIFIAALNFGLAFLVKKMYPQYSTFYIHQYYNHEWYFLAGIGLTLVTSWIFGSMLLKKFGNKNIGLATAFLLAVLTLVLYFFVRTGTYLMMYPMIALTIGLLVSEYIKTNEKQWQSWVLAFGMFSVFIGFWTTVSHNLFLGFSFGALPGAVIPTALFCFASLALLPVLWKKKEYLIPIFGICLFSYSMINAHLRSKPSEEEPLKSNLFFVSDRTANQQFWASRDHFINDGHLNLLDGAEKGRLPRHLPFSRFMKKSSLNADGFATEFIIDSIPESKSVLIKMINPKRAAKSFLVLNEIENVDKILIDGQLNKQFSEGATGFYSTVLFGIGLDSMEVEIVKRDYSKPVETYFNFSYQEPLKEEEMPKGIVRNDGYTYIAESVKF
jgi:hypothetical protein